MHILTRALLVWMMALAMIVGACSKTVEGESNKWTANSATVTELSAQYPGFKPAIEARKQAAQKIYDAAAGLDGDAKIEKLAEANTALMNGFVRELDVIDDRMKKLREGRVEAAALAGDSTQLGAKVAVEDAQKALDRVEATLKSGAADEASAAAILKKVNADLETAQKALDKLLAVDKSKKDDAAAAKKTEGDAKAAEAAAADAKVAPWKCEYCGNSNTHDKTSCESCGAARAADKAAKPDAKAATK
jgi:DNA repair exonuclease SbcCD ATPase subunit